MSGFDMQRGSTIASPRGTGRTCIIVSSLADLHITGVKELTGAHLCTVWFVAQGVFFLPECLVGLCHTTAELFDEGHQIWGEFCTVAEESHLVV